VKSEPLDLQPRSFVHAAVVGVLLAMVVMMAPQRVARAVARRRSP